MSVLATSITHLAPSDREECERCPQVLKPTRRAGVTLCEDCHLVMIAIERAERYNVDLAALAEDEWWDRARHARRGNPPAIRVRKIDTTTGEILPWPEEEAA